jgi:hypothetical protein
MHVPICQFRLGALGSGATFATDRAHHGGFCEGPCSRPGRSVPAFPAEARIGMASHGLLQPLDAVPMGDCLRPVAMVRLDVGGT